MNELFNSIRQFILGLRLWVVIAPWEQGLRVRLGRHVKLLGAGVHPRIPAIDYFYTQSIRMRISGFGRNTVSSKDGQTITFAGAVGYSIADLETLYRTLHHAEDTIQNLVRGEIANYIYNHSANDCLPLPIAEGCAERINLSRYGLSEVKVYLTDFAVVKTYRLIGDYGSGGMMGSSLSTERQDGKPA